MTLNPIKRWNIQLKFNGHRRSVLLIKDVAIKIPTFKSWCEFIYGIVENYQERYWYIGEDTVTKYRDRRNWPYYHMMAKVLWADRFGLCVIQERVEPVTDENQFMIDLQNAIDSGIKFPTSDIKSSNFGYRDGHLVCIDYGYFNAAAPCYVAGRHRYTKYRD